MPLIITPLYTALIALLFIALSWRIITYRRANAISLGDSGDKNLLKRMRAQANCAEYAPLGLLLLAMTELNQAPALAIHALGLMLLAGRLLHAAGFAATPQRLVLRQVGMVLTLTMIGLTALGLLAHAAL
jgi:hypothetical protein